MQALGCLQLLHMDTAWLSKRYKEAYPLAHSRNGLLNILDIQIPGSCDCLTQAVLKVMGHLCRVQLAQI